MSRALDSDEAVHGAVKAQVRKHADEVVALAESVDDTDRFRVKDLSPGHTAIVDTFKKTPVITVVERQQLQWRSYCNIYALEDEAIRTARDTVESRDPICPCGHSGLENHGEFYTCAFALCPNTYGRDHLEVDG